MTLEFRELGPMLFQEAECLQLALCAQRESDQISDTILLLEHPPVYTYGKQQIEQDFIASETWRNAQGIEIAAADRGGRITYHGPGQLVGYLILKLTGWRTRVPLLVARIETALIATLSHFGISAQRDALYPGVWVASRRGGEPPAKIAAIGLHISHGITRHGFSLNISPNLSHYSGIIPCGISDRAVTSMEKELGVAPSLEAVTAVLKPILMEALGD